MKRLIILIICLMSVDVFAQGGGVQRNINISPDNPLVLDIFDAGATVVDKVPSEPNKWGSVVVEAQRNAINEGHAFRGEYSFSLDSGETIVFHSLTSGDTVEVQGYEVNIWSTSEASYEVYLEPSGITDNGTPMVRSKNPHIQFIGGYQFTFEIWRQPTLANLGIGPIRGPIRWGNGSKVGGTKIQEDVTTLSPTQRLAYVVKSFVNDNWITFRVDGYEVQGGVEE